MCVSVRPDDEHTCSVTWATVYYLLALKKKKNIFCFGDFISFCLKADLCEFYSVCINVCVSVYRVLVCVLLVDLST